MTTLTGPATCFDFGMCVRIRQHQPAARMAEQAGDPVLPLQIDAAAGRHPAVHQLRRKLGDMMRLEQCAVRGVVGLQPMFGEARDDVADLVGSQHGQGMCQSLKLSAYARDLGDLGQEHER